MNHTENRTRNGSVGVGTTTVAYTISGSDDQTGNNDRCHKSSSKPHSQYDPSQVRDESYGTKYVQQKFCLPIHLFGRMLNALLKIQPKSLNAITHNFALLYRYLKNGLFIKL